MSAPAITSSPILDWSQRPPALKTAIEEAFAKLKTNDSWSFSGESDYTLCNVDERLLAKRIIQQAPDSQKKFYFLDIGAGGFEWGKALAKFLQEQADLSADIEIHVIGIRGEPANEPVQILGRCTVQNLGGFKIEQLSTEFQKIGLSLENKVDMAVSRWTFRHFVDPVGTFAQTFNLLRPKTGLFLVDGFFYLCNNETQREMNMAAENGKMVKLLTDTNAPFLIRPFQKSQSLNQFILRRPDEQPCTIPMRYERVCSREPQNTLDFAGDYLTSFSRDPQSQSLMHAPLHGNDDTLLGNQDLYQWIKKADPGIPRPMTRAIIEGDEETFQQQLEKGYGNETDPKIGIPPLQLSMLHRRKEFFRLLLLKNVNPNRVNQDGLTAIHEAIKIKDDDEYLSLLLKQPRINLTQKLGVEGTSALGLALKVGNANAIEQLAAKGAKLTIEEEAKFIAHEYVPFLAKLIPASNICNPYQTFSAWLKGGDCVLLQREKKEPLIYGNPHPRRMITISLAADQLEKEFLQQFEEFGQPTKLDAKPEGQFRSFTFDFRELFR